MNKDFFKLPDKVFGFNITFLKLFIVPFLILLAFVVSFNLVISPKFSSLSDQNKSISLVNQQIDLTTQKINYLSSVDQEQIKNDIGYLESAVLQEKNSYFLVGVIRKVADKYGFSVSSFSVSAIEVKNNDSKGTLKVADKDVATKLPISVVLYGPDSERVNLIMALENTLPILFIDSLDISSSSGYSTLDMKISSYYIAEKSDLVSGDLSLKDLIPTQEENDLLKTISSFSRVDSGFSAVGDTSSFVKYDRENPFTL